jgi:hypothetical protein
MEKSIPFLFFTSWIRMLFPFFDPLAFPKIATSPFSMAMTGLMDKIFPAQAAVFEMRPPCFKYSRVSKTAKTQTSFFFSSSFSAISFAESPSSRSFTA